MEHKKVSLISERDFSPLDLDLSPIKKDLIKKQRRESLRTKLRQSLPVLNKQEIRRFRLPYHEALLAELIENGYVSTAEFISQLLDLQDKTRNKSGPGTAIWTKPELKNSKPNLDLLVKSLTKAEDEHNKENFATEWDEILHLAAYYAFGSDNWWWLGEQLLYQCVSLEYPGDFHKQEAISYFIIGKYLVENGKKVESARYYLDLARDMSEGKSWNCTKILNKKQDVVFIESCRLLCTTLMEEASSIKKSDPKRAAEICNIARKRAAEACDYNSEYKALLLRARCELLLHASADAIATVTKALNRTRRKKDIKGMCEASIGLALANLQHGKTTECLNILKGLKTLAEENHMPFYVAQAYRFMGEYYLHQKQPYEATPLLMVAFYLFHENNDLDRREKVRTWASISAGEELFPAFIGLIKDCNSAEYGHESLMQLIRWIDEKEFFWTQQTKFTFSLTSLQESILESSTEKSEQNESIQ